MTDWNNFTAKWTELSKANLRLVDIDTYTQSGLTYYNGVYVQGTDAYALWRTSDWNTFNKFYQDNQSKLRLIDLDFKMENGALWYTGVWLGAPTGQQLVANLAWNDFVQQWTELSTHHGMRLTRIQAYPVGNDLHYTGVFEPGSGGYALYNTTDWNAFIQLYQSYNATMELADFQVVDLNGTRNCIGVWRETQAKHEFVYNLDWSSFVSQWNTLSASGYRLKYIEQYQGIDLAAPPKWAQSFQEQLGAKVEGYAFATAQFGTGGPAGNLNLARSSHEPHNPSQAWTPDTRFHLASVSKPVTAVVLLHLLEQPNIKAQNITVDSPFYPIIKGQLSGVDPNTNPKMPTITLKNLLTMKSGMVGDGTLDGDLWPFLSAYLKQPNLVTGTPGVTELYSNTNYTIVQAVIEHLSGMSYVDYTRINIFNPMGINSNVFNATPDPADTSALTYSGLADTQPGQYWGAFRFVACGGWVASARELLKFMIGVRGNVVLSPQTTDMMFTEGLGWYPYDGKYGRYYHHNGALVTGATPPQGETTGVIHFTDGYDAALLINTPLPGFDIITPMVQAFETR